MTQDNGTIQGDKVHKGMFELNYSKKKIIITCVFLLFFDVGAIRYDVSPIWIIGCSVLVSIFSLIKISETKVGHAMTYVFCLAIAPVLTTLISQSLQRVPFFGLTGIKIIWGGLICLAVLLLLQVVLDRLRLSTLLMIITMVSFSVIGYYVFLFRRSELAPTDFLAIKTATTVVFQYKIRPYAELFICGLLCFIVVEVLIALPKTEKRKNKCEKKIKNRLISFVAFLCVVGILTIPLFAQGMESAFWAQAGTEENGFLLNFVLKCKESIITKPEGYSKEALEEINLSYEDSKTSKTDEFPTIIVIMNESLTDFEPFGGVNTKETYLPYLNSLQDNTVKGHALASVFGAKTPNSEFEVLTGNTMGFLSSTNVPYLQFMKYQSYSMAAELNSIGYTSYAFHPAPRTNYRRDSVYSSIGFKQFYDLSYFEKAELVRDFTTDESMYQELERFYEEKIDDEGPLFIFGVTIQNHGGYEKEYDSTMELEGYSQDYPQTEQYLSLAQESDKAFENFTEYFEGVNDKVVILMFGDHYPAVEEDFYNEVSKGVPNAELEKYDVPFWIWANYDIEEAQGIETSLNYLQNYLYVVAGIPMPAYSQALSDIQEDIPRINGDKYYSLSQKAYIDIDEATGEEAEALKKYNIIEYNNMFAKDKDKLDMFKKK